MKRTTRWMLFTVAATLFLTAWHFTPRVASQGRKPAKSIPSPSAAQATSPGPVDRANRKPKVPVLDGKSPGKVGADAEEDPDLPAFMQGKIDKETYLLKRAEHINLLRGLPHDLPFDPRAKAIGQMQNQEAKRTKELKALGLSAETSESSWTPLGPTPIPNGQTSGISTPVSGRTIAIAIHPTNPDVVYVGTAQGGLYKTINGGENWTMLFDFDLESLAIGAITIDPADTNIVYVGTGEPNLSGDSFAGRGLYIIRDANSKPILSGPFGLNQQGSNVFNGRAISKILIHPTNKNIIFISTTSGIGGNPSVAPATLPPRGIYRSTNAQSTSPTFTKITIPEVAADDRSLVDMVLEPENPDVLLCTVLAIVADGGGIYRSNDALVATPTFTRTLELNGVRAELAINKVESTVTVLAATGENPNPPPPGTPVCPAGQSGMVRKSTDGGVTWSGPLPGSQGFCGGQCFYDIAIALHPDNNTIILGGSARGTCSDVMKRSTNGTTFARDDIGLHADTHANSFAPSNPSIAYTGSDGGFWKSADAGDTWTSMNNMDFSATQFQDLALHPFDRWFTIGGTQDNGTNFLQPDKTWRRADFGDGGYSVIDQNAGDTTNVTMYHTYFNQTNNIVGYGRVFNTASAQDAGWEFRNCTSTGIRCADNVLFYAPMVNGPGNPNTLYFGTDRLYRSADSGTTMQLVSQGPLVPVGTAGTSGVPISSIGISPQNDNVRIVGLTNGSVFATTTGSTTLTDVTSPNFPPNPITPARRPIGRAVIDPNNPDTAYVTFTHFGVPDGQHVWKTTSLSDTTPVWSPAGSGIPDVPVNALAIDPLNSNAVYAGTDIGVFRSLNGGASWLPFNNGLPRVAVFDMEIQNAQRILRIVTHGRGLYEILVPGSQLPVIRNASVTLTNESCEPANNTIDPNERVTVNLSVQNVGPGGASNITATLLPTGGVTVPSGPVSFSLAPGATASRDFSFTASGACGGTITLTFQLQEGPLNLGTVSFTFTLGTLVTTGTAFTENFDGVTPPALPPGWTTSTTGTGRPWVTTNASSDTPPNAVGTDASGANGNLTNCTGGDGSATLTSPTVAIPPAAGPLAFSQVTFSHFFNLEAGFDGGVLEISIDGGAFQDIIAAGGSFVSGGYTGQLDPGTLNPLAGRQAWTGNSGGLLTTTVRLPNSANNQSVQFRWRSGYDECFTPPNAGWVVDTISIPTLERVCSSACDAGGTGLKGEYYDQIDFTDLKVTRTDATVNFNLGEGSPDPSIDPETFSVRWTGQVQPRFSETYTLYTVSDDGVRLTVNGQVVVDNLTIHPATEDSGTITLAAGQKYDIRLEYYENTFDAVIQLLWSSPSQAKEVVPRSQLFPAN